MSDPFGRDRPAQMIKRLGELYGPDGALASIKKATVSTIPNNPQPPGYIRTRLHPAGIHASHEGVVDGHEAGRTMARRTCYDLLHAVDFIPYEGYKTTFVDNWRRNAEHRLSVFCAGSSIKDYRIRKLEELDKAHGRIAELCALLDHEGIGVPNDTRIPF